MLIRDIWKKIKQTHHTIGVSRLAPTSVVSDIFPGQFNYCLDEIHLLKKYGNFVDITEEEHFQKMMPVVRWNDFMSQYHNNIQSSEHQKKEYSKQHHLGVFTMSTIGGGHITDPSRNQEYLNASVTSLMDFLVHDMQLEKERFVISYFAGGVTARSIEASIKDPTKKLKVEVEKVMPEDPFSKQAFIEWGVSEAQLMPNITRDNFLTSNWDVFLAPWGYRNEVHYRLDNGELLDIATIENLVYKPVTVDRAGVQYVSDVLPWEKSFVINGVGIERLALATSGQHDIYTIPDFARFLEIDKDPYHIEVARMLHRILTDCDYTTLEGRSRREKINMLMREIQTLPLITIVNILHANATIYRSLFPELGNTIPIVVQNITNLGVEDLER